MISLNDFFQKYPAINKSKFCEEAGITTRSLYYYMAGQRSPSPDTQQRIDSIIKKYKGR